METQCFKKKESSNSIIENYQDYLDVLAGLNEPVVPNAPPLAKPSRVGVVGAGMAGLYSAMLLQQTFPGIKVKVFDASNRVGGAVHTYKFSSEPYDYFEAGAMRIPVQDHHQHVFALIDYLNNLFPTDPIELIDYNFHCPQGNRVLVNNKKRADGGIMSIEYAKSHCTELGFPDEATADGNSSSIFAEAIKPLEEAFESDFEAALIKYKAMSFREYLMKELNWSYEKTRYLETLSCQTYDLDIGLTELLLLPRKTAATGWKSIKGGMSKLPEFCEKAIKKMDGEIELEAKVEALVNQADGSVRIGYTKPDSHHLIYEDFDLVVSAISLPFLRLMPQRSFFGADFEEALRFSNFEAANKLGMRFKTRFWERSDLNLPPSYGGQSITDLPIRWVVYPSFGFGDKGKGILIIYNWRHDAAQWHLLSKPDKIKLALQNLQQLYPEVDIASEYAGGRPGGENFESESVVFDYWGRGVMDAHPGQCLKYFPALIKPRGSVYFTGGHLSSSVFWIASALEASRRTVRLIGKKYSIADVDYIG